MIDYLTLRNPALREEQLKKRNRLRRIAKIKKIIAYILILCIVGASHYIVLVIFANSEDNEGEAENWAINYLISLAQDMGVSQIIKVLLTIVCLRLRASARNPTFKKILALMIDPVTVRALAMTAMTMPSRRRDAGTRTEIKRKKVSLLRI